MIDVRPRSVGLRIRKALTKFYLDTAEQLPPFGGGFIRELQGTRERERRASRELHEASQKPTGVELTYLGFRLVELFPAEEYGTLVRGLRRLFPAKPFERDVIDRLSSSAPSIFGGGWSVVGTVVREDKWLGPFEKTVLAELPSEVETVDCQVQKILPSAVVLSLDVSLGISATQQMSELLNRWYLPVTVLSRFTPWRGRRTGMSQTPAEYTMEEALLSWQLKLHEQVWACFNSYLSGYFSNSGGGNAYLPAIDCFAVADPDKDSEAPQARSNLLHRWFEYASVLPRAGLFNKWERNDLMFIQEHIRDERHPIPHRFVQLMSSRPEPDPTKRQGIYALQDEMDAVLPYVCLFSALRRITESVEKLRLRVYKRLAGTRIIDSPFSFELRLNDRIQREEMFVSRVSMELADALPLFRGGLSVLRGLTQKLGGEEHELEEGLDEELLFRLRQVKRHLRLISKVFDGYISRRSLSLMYRLQWQVWLLTGVGTAAAVIGALSNRDLVCRLMVSIFQK